MSEIKHTPGPWTACGDTGYGGHNGHRIRVGQFGYIVAVAIDDVPELNGHANARLIAAAPELLSELKRIVFEWDGEPEDMAEARAAIAKAEGRS